MSMQKPALLYLVHRIPFPPNKGDKVRSYHLLRQLAQDYRVFLGCFIDQPEDWAHVDSLRQWCEDVHVEGIQPRMARLLSLRGLLSGEALTLPYYRNAGMQAWVDAVSARHDIRRAVVFSSSMGQYLDRHPDVRPVVDFVDVDSAKWARYAEDHAGPMAWLYRREGARLADYERALAARASCSVLVSEAEAALFREVAPTQAARIRAVSNGVDAAFFSPERSGACPYAEGEQAVVFTGAMDYWPNIDAASWFAQSVWPVLRAQAPAARFYIVGMNPAPELRTLDGRDGIVVTGTVPDVRPYTGHARAVVAPLRVARGVQNKILEAMSMARPVVASATCAGGLMATPGEHLLVADTAEAFAARVAGLLDAAGQRAGDALGQAARQCVLAHYSWEAHLAVFPSLIEAAATDEVAHV